MIFFFLPTPDREQQRRHLDAERAVEDVRHRRAHGPEHRQAAQRTGQHTDVADGRGGRGRHR